MKLEIIKDTRRTGKTTKLIKKAISNQLSSDNKSNVILAYNNRQYLQHSSMLKHIIQYYIKDAKTQIKFISKIKIKTINNNNFYFQDLYDSNIYIDDFDIFYENKSDFEIFSILNLYTKHNNLYLSCDLNSNNIIKCLSIFRIKNILHDLYTTKHLKHKSKSISKFILDNENKK